MRRPVLAFLLALSFLPSLANTVSAQGSDSVLSRRLPRYASGRPVEWKQGQTIEDVLQMLRGVARVPVVSEAPPGSTVTLPRTIDLTDQDVETALRTIIAVDPRYSWTEIGGVVVLRPATAWKNSANPLNQRVTSIAWNNMSLDEVLARTFNIIFSTGHVGGEEPQLPRLSVTVSSGTVLDVLIAAARQHPLVAWSASYDTRKTDVRGFVLGYFDHSMREIGKMAGRSYGGILPHSLALP